MPELIRQPRAPDTPDLSRTSSLAVTNQLPVPELPLQYLMQIGHFWAVTRFMYDSDLSCGLLGAYYIVPDNLEKEHGLILKGLAAKWRNKLMGGHVMHLFIMKCAIIL